MNKTVDKNENAFNFNLDEDEVEIVDAKTLKSLHLQNDFTWENEIDLEDLYGDFNND